MTHIKDFMNSTGSNPIVSENGIYIWLYRDRLIYYNLNGNGIMFIENIEKFMGCPHRSYLKEQHIDGIDKNDYKDIIMNSSRYNHNNIERVDIKNLQYYIDKYNIKIKTLIKCTINNNIKKILEVK